MRAHDFQEDFYYTETTFSPASNNYLQKIKNTD